ncbi:MAG TPA: hypothetical protein VLG47_04185 [Candidatus Saccharimonadales bacterium]|nr:hypothetical protein [Candidatus Saccharimonadales bacterium]
MIKNLRPVEKLTNINLKVLSVKHLVVLGAVLVVAFGALGPVSLHTNKADASIVAPQWLVNYISGKVGGAATSSVMGTMGFQCAGRIVCWSNTNYDPPRWFYYGVVQTGNGPSGYLRARGWPSSNGAVIRTFPENWKLVLFCQTHGDWVYGRWGWTNVWDYIGHYGDAPMFVSDGFVYTGTNGFVSGACDSTNFGGNP